MDQPIRSQTGLGQTGRKKITARHAPQHFATGARRNTSSKKCCSCAIDSAIAADLMQRTERQSATRQPFIDFCNAEGQHCTRAPGRAFKMRNARLKLGNNRTDGIFSHWFQGSDGFGSITIRSLFVLKLKQESIRFSAPLQRQRHKKPARSDCHKRNI